MERTCVFKTSRIVSKGLLAVVILGFFMVQNAGAIDPPILYLFWGEGCPHCEHEKTFLKDFHQQYPQVEIRLFETWQHPEFANLANELRKAYQIKGAGVPLTVMGDWYLVGFSFSGNYSQQIIAQAETCLQQGCPDALDRISSLDIAAQIRTEAANNAPNDWERYPAISSPAPTRDSQEKVVVYYFHGTEDCPVCLQIEQLTRQAVEERFQDELQHGRVEFQRINAEDPKNRSFIEKYQLTARVLIVSKLAQGKETQWKSLQKVWELLDNEPALTQYVQTEIGSYLKEKQ